MTERPPLPATGYAVLGLLSFGRELSGYDLKKWADASLRLFYWSPAISQIYAELRRLEGLRLVTSREVPQDDLRNKRVYRITDAGRDVLGAWVGREAIEPPVLKHSVALRVWLGHLAAPDRLRAIVEEHRAWAEGMLAEARRSAGSATRDDEWGAYPRLVMRWAERHYRAERDAATAMLADLDALAGSPAPPQAVADPSSVSRKWAT